MFLPVSGNCSNDAFVHLLVAVILLLHLCVPFTDNAFRGVFVFQIVAMFEFLYLC